MTKHNKTKKTLSLNTETVRALQDEQLDGVAGGYIVPPTGYCTYNCTVFGCHPKTPACPI